jgi:hypothetical protein
MKKTGLIAVALLLFIGVSAQSGSTAYFVTNPAEVIHVNKITKEEVYSYTFNKKGIRDSSLYRVCYYDNAGNKVQDIWGKSVSKYSNAYDSSGRLQRQVQSREDLKFITISEYEYDQFGNELTKYHYNKDTTSLTVEQKVYNDKKQLVQLWTTINNRPQYLSRLYYYNSDNELIKTEALDQRGKVIYSYIYEYDKAQNKKTTYLENSDGRRTTEVSFYNTDKQPVKIYDTYKRPVSINAESVQFAEFDQRTENIYNPDKTVFESNVYVEGKKVQMRRHYYFR